MVNLLAIGINRVEPVFYYIDNQTLVAMTMSQNLRFFWHDLQSLGLFFIPTRPITTIPNMPRVQPVKQK